MIEGSEIETKKVQSDLRKNVSHHLPVLVLDGINMPIHAKNICPLLEEITSIDHGLPRLFREQSEILKSQLSQDLHLISLLNFHRS
jgi:hypothetical protein